MGHGARVGSAQTDNKEPSPCGLNTHRVRIQGLMHWVLGGRQRPGPQRTDPWHRGMVILRVKYSFKSSLVEMLHKLLDLTGFKYFQGPVCRIQWHLTLRTTVVNPIQNQCLVCLFWATVETTWRTPVRGPASYVDINESL